MKLGLSVQLADGRHGGDDNGERNQGADDLRTPRTHIGADRREDNNQRGYDSNQRENDGLECFHARDVATVEPEHSQRTISRE